MRYAVPEFAEELGPAWAGARLPPHPGVYFEDANGDRLVYLVAIDTETGVACHLDRELTDTEVALVWLIVPTPVRMIDPWAGFDDLALVS